MKIRGVRTWKESLELTRPYAIAYSTFSAVDILFVILETDEGPRGLGSGSPVEVITGESVESCAAALEPETLAWLVGENPLHLQSHCRRLEVSHGHAPAARAAVDMALHDLHAAAQGLPLVEVLGRCHTELPTSITIGIRSVEESLAEAEEYLGRGFRILKVKTGKSPEEDLERLTRLREAVGPGVKIRADANLGYTSEETLRFFESARGLDLEFLEQPLPAREIEAMRGFPEEVRSRIAADESLCTEADARALAHPSPACGIFNIKLMKCGGIQPALRIANIAEIAGIDLMWGCMDESVISIAAALHAAFACQRTRYLDLDGSLDLARDLATGGFTIVEGMMRLTVAPGLGVSLAEEDYQ